MKSTGIIRRIDELGRIVIPKEIRKKLRIHDGDSLEIFTDDEKIVLTKYSSIGSLNESVSNFAQTLQKFLNCDIIITDNDKIIATSSSIKGNYELKELNSNLLKYLNNRQLYVSTEKINLKITEKKELMGYFIISPIIVSSEGTGLIIAYSKEKSFSDSDVNLIKFVNTFFTKYLED